MSNIIVANPHGFCFGVSRAIEIAQNTSKNSTKPIFMLGELVHNQHVIDWLEQKLHIKTVKDLKEIPTGSIIIIRSHGASPSIYQEIKDRGLEVVDATCPMVLRSHETVKKLSSQKKDIIFLCNKIDHDETIGVVGEAPDFVTPITLKDIFNFRINDSKNTIVINQTTLSTIETKEALNFLKNKYPEISILPHICQATTDRQNAIIDLAKKYKFVIIVGAPTSANSNSLQSVAESVGAKSFIVDNASQLNPDWFKDQKNIVISSGASTPENVLNEVISKIEDIIHQ
ncbi:MAG: 4-hydroxy-3-methylbut-2-enyl diphosphate reductase [Candidatus Shapirobacteria bacterium]|nr:4-hydroxy-3-methylbut-2-enyl diphosphate reductase [Candidatus Shapirobacteria bacterium]